MLHFGASTKLKFIEVAVIFFTTFASAISHPDEVLQLSGLNFSINYKHYSGYLNATSGRHLHYWFVESQRSPSSDPVILWLNGGPGCSSLDGFLVELGPLLVSADGRSLYDNPYSWNKVANVLFLEAPSGVGFSYADNKNYSTDDVAVSYDNYAALQSFFEKFPLFKGNDFYIAGESYAGIYIPTLSVRVLKGPADINFKGFAIGNGHLDDRHLENSIVFFAYYHGLVGSEVWRRLEKYCCRGMAIIKNCNFFSNLSPSCQKAVEEVNEIVNESELNIYNLYSECGPSDPRDERSNGITPKSVKGYKGDHPCVDFSNLRKYLNQPAVREALHIPTFVQDWDICSTDVKIGYRRIYNTMKPQLWKLIGSGKLRGLIYNGDADMVCNFLANEWFSYDLGFEALDTYKPWKFNDQIAGFVKYFKNLTYLTIRGAGHMVPQDKPGPAYHMITSFLNNTPL